MSAAATHHRCAHCGFTGDFSGTGPHACPGCETTLCQVGTAPPMVEPDALATVLPVEREIIVKAIPDDEVRFEGTAAQLVAEGVIPNGFECPRGAADKRWKANGFDYWLSRRRPAGHKGPMRSWLELDNWSIRIQVTGRDHHWHILQRLQRQTEELAAARHRHTPDGERESMAHFSRYYQAQTDKAFQCFKAICVPQGKTRGRKPKSISAAATPEA